MRVELEEKPMELSACNQCGGYHLTPLVEPEQAEIVLPLGPTEIWSRIMATYDKRKREKAHLQKIIEGVAETYRLLGARLTAADLMREVHRIYNPKTRRQRSYFNRLFTQFDGREIKRADGRTYTCLNTGWRRMGG